MTSNWRTAPVTALAPMVLAFLLLGCARENPSAPRVAQGGKPAAPVARPVVPKTAEEVLALLRKAPDPMAIVESGERDSPECIAMLKQLDAMRRVDPKVISDAYKREEAVYGSLAQDLKLDNVMRLLTRFLYRVEDIKDKPRFSFPMGDGARTADPLWPLVKGPSGLTLVKDSERHYRRGIYPSANAEYQYVKSRVPRR